MTGKTAPCPALGPAGYNEKRATLDFGEMPYGYTPAVLASGDGCHRQRGG